MDRSNNLLETALRLLADLGGTVVGALVDIELWIRDILTAAGVPHGSQTSIVLGLAVFLFLITVRLVGGVIRTTILLILLTIMIQIVVPLLLT